MTVPKKEIQELDIKLHAGGYKRKFSFSIGYAFAWALLFEGLFSTLYHLCPSKMTFQFDTAFMFLIAGLIVVLQHNGIELEECSPEGEAKGHVGAANFFLGFIVPLYILNYFGSLYHSEVGLSFTSFFIPLGVWSILIAVWAAYRLFPKEWSKTCTSEDKCKLSVVCSILTLNPLKWSGKFVWFIFALILTIIFLSLAGASGNFPLAFLFICISGSGCAIVWRAVKKMKNLCDGCQCKVLRLFCCQRTWDWLFIGQVLYILVFSAIMIAALVLFIAKPSTDKASTPERSRDLNHECVDVFGFFDFHDLWHILSSFALLMGAHLVMYISYDPPTVTEPENNDANQTSNDGTDQNTVEQGQTAWENRGSQPSPTKRNERGQGLHPPNRTRNDGTDQTTAGQGQMAMQNRGFQPFPTERNIRRQRLHPPNQTRNYGTHQTTAGQGQMAMQNRGFQPSPTERNERRQGLNPPNQTRNYGTDQTTAGQGQTARQNRGFQPSPTDRNERRQGLHPPNQIRNNGTDQTTAGQGRTARQNRGFQPSLAQLKERRQRLRPPNQTRNYGDQTTAGQGQTARQNRGFQPSLAQLKERRQRLRPPSSDLTRPLLD